MSQYQQCLVDEFEGFERVQSVVKIIDLTDNDLLDDIIVPEATNPFKTERAVNMVARASKAQTKIYSLPSYLSCNYSDLIEDFKVNLQNNKITKNKPRIDGENCCIHDFVSKLKKVYSKSRTQKSIKQLKFDYSSKKQIIRSPFNYIQQNQRQIVDPLPKSTLRNSFEFQSRFECGNLYQAFEYRLNQYILVLQNDTNTYGYNQWFFFRVRNMKTDKVIFHIINMNKGFSLFKVGMKIAIFSEKRYKNQNIGWFRGGQNILYYNNQLIKPSKEDCFYYTLSFQYEFKDFNDSVYFAMNIPYTYTKMINFIQQSASIFQNNEIQYELHNAGFTHNNNVLPLVHINNKNQITKGVVILSRQHPNQISSSFVLEGIIEFLNSKNQFTQPLLDNYQFIIFPMINPDGVIEGHSRCNKAGIDLNRQWSDNLVKQLTPENFFIKKSLQNICSKIKIQYLIDLHGHSKKMDSFFYGCEKESKVETRLMSVLMSKIQSNFNMFSCRYGITRDKINTIRSQMHQAGIENIFTLECSFFGVQNVINKRKTHFSIKDLKDIGASLLKAITFMISPDSLNKKLFKFTKAQLLTQTTKKINLYERQQSKFIEADSQSDPDGDTLPLQEKLKNINENQQNKNNFENQLYLSKKRLKPEQQRQRYQKSAINLNINRFKHVSKERPRQFRQTLSTSIKLSKRMLTTARQHTHSSSAKSTLKSKIKCFSLLTNHIKKSTNRRHARSNAAEEKKDIATSLQILNREKQLVQNLESVKQSANLKNATTTKYQRPRQVFKSRQQYFLSKSSEEVEKYIHQLNHTQEHKNILYYYPIL